MPPTLDQAGLKLAADIFESLGTAAGHRVVYGVSHPRFSSAMKSALDLFAEYFKANPEAKHLVFTISPEGVEYQKVPLVNLSASAERLLAALRGLVVGMVQIDRELAAADLDQLVERLSSRPRGPRPSSQTRGTAATPGQAPAQAPAEDSGHASGSPAARQSERNLAECSALAQGPTRPQMLEQDRRDAAGVPGAQTSPQSPEPAPAEAVTPALAPAPLPGSEGRKFRFFSPDDVRLMLAARRKPAEVVEEPSPTSIGLPSLKVSESTLSAVVTTYHALLLNAEQGVAFDYSSLRQSTEHLVKMFRQKQDTFLSNVSKGYFDDFTFHHSVNVGLITAKLASLIVTEQDLLSRITTAALLHDIGKTRIPGEILLKPGRLTPGEAEHMRQHPTNGAEILLSTDGMDPLCVAVAFGHHSHGAKGSYPKTHRPYQADWVTQLISVVDIYEALTAVRPYKKGLPPDKAFEVMVSMPGLKDRLPIVKLLYDLLGPYPVGAIVELHTGERAVVLEQNRAEPYRPRIRIVTDKEGIPYPLPLEVDLAAPPKRGQKRFVISHTVIAQNQNEDPLRKKVMEDPRRLMRETLEEEESFYMREG